MTQDIVDQIAGVTPALDALRRRRPVTREQLQATFDALFHPVSTEHVSLAERELVAAFATGLAGTDATATFYAARALDVEPERAAVVLAEAASAAQRGPFGVFAEDGLQGENTEGERYAPSLETSVALGQRLASALAHTHLLVFRPREAGVADLRSLLAAGWSPDGIVTLSQLISFLAFQQRVVTGLRVLSATGLAEDRAANIALAIDSEEEAA
ncbi:CMD domain protein [Microbacterium sp. LWO13-1.2]|uniref:CMD domain protein n=1 Tax=Microbacterium sp. LWO13-1.2 TaxID=3135262 RepID=UPI003138D207